jgi:diguanylate cyclase (GGDEF)-like protein
MHAFELVRTITGKGDKVYSAESDSASLKQVLAELHFTRYQYIIHSLTGQCFSRAQAKEMWLGVLSHQADMICELKRDPGIVVAALDYLENISPTPGSQFIFIQQNELRRLVEMSLLDGLTQLYNRNTFMLLTEKEVQLSKRHHKTAALLLIDLDNFKTINDENGHQQGDDALIATANAINESIRSMDIAGRYGGDEFIVFLPDANKYDASIIADRIKKGINNKFLRLNNVEVNNKITVSIGTSLFPNNGKKVNDLIFSADMALYKAKGNGKNLVVHSS